MVLYQFEIVDRQKMEIVKVREIAEEIAYEEALYSDWPMDYQVKLKASIEDSTQTVYCFEVIGAYND